MRLRVAKKVLMRGIGGDTRRAVLRALKARRFTCDELSEYGALGPSLCFRPRRMDGGHIHLYARALGVEL